MKRKDLGMLLAGVNHNCTRGYFYVKKINVLARFSFGKSGSFDTVGEAHNALESYLLKRKDSDSLDIGFCDWPA